MLRMLNIKLYFEIVMPEIFYFKELNKYVKKNKESNIFKICGNLWSGFFLGITGFLPTTNTERITAQKKL